MKSYLSLIPIAAKKSKRKNRMIFLCIVIAVFLVTSVFSLADASVRMEKARAINKYGNWHIQIRNLTQDEAMSIINRSDIKAASFYDVRNYSLDENYSIGSKKAIVCGTEEPLVTDILQCLRAGDYPRNANEIMLSENAGNILDVRIGDTVLLKTPSGDREYRLSGFVEDTSLIMDCDAIGAFLNRDGFETLCADNHEKTSGFVYFIQFKEGLGIRKAITQLQQIYGEDNVSENTALLGTLGLSGDSYVMGMYVVAAVLFVLILIAGVLMIAGSINSNLSERTQFFGMLRCIGASKRQIIQFVRFEALSWCKAAVPAGIVLGVFVTCGICAVLHYGVGGDFSQIPVVVISPAGILSGAVVGVLTVLIAAAAPARKAAKVSPVAAVSGNSDNTGKVRHAVRSAFLKSKIETALGIHHAVSAKKNLLLMTGSFAFSILLFLGFSVMIDFTGFAITSLRPYAPDLSIVSNDVSPVIDKGLIQEIGKEPAVKRVFGRMYKSMPASFEGKEGEVDLISYEQLQFDWAKADVLSGDISRVQEDDSCVMTVFDKSNSLKTGDVLVIDGKTVEVACVLSDSPFDSDENPTVICSEKSFAFLTGESNYTIVDIQLNKTAADADVQTIRNLTGEAYTISDRRDTNKEARGTYWAFNILAYSFLGIISMITVFYIINSISMSVSARIKQYGAMRAVGMDASQLIRMIASEVSMYDLCGCLAGCLLGVPLNRFLFQKMITGYWGIPWSVPVRYLAVILLMVVAASVVAVHIPAKRILNMEITNTINKLQ